MKLITNLIFSIILSVFLHAVNLANEIDSIKTDEDINYFMGKHFGDKYRSFSVADTNYIWYNHDNKYPYSIIADTLGMKFWYKADFNGDKKTDLLVYGSYKTGNDEHVYKYANIFGVIETEIGKYQLIPFYCRFGVAFPVVVQQPYPLVLLYQTIEDIFAYKSHTTYNIGVSHEKLLLAAIDYNPYVYVDTLISKFGTFIEFNSTPKTKRIREIEFENSCGMMACYVMNLKIERDRTATMIGGQSYENKIKYSTRIKIEQFKEIVELINYLDFGRINPAYSSFITDDSSIKLKIRYDGNNFKEISDYGETGTYGLRKLYKMLYDLKYTQNWRR